ncbi:hypothetical protein EIG99_11730 [Staphylococcus condimenti]|uniref:Uncharacterized protein n=1 Tax=Staphylococcus condimenti TaxID=70255 RepID=A0A4Q7CRE0_9STAP|nr:hypothetical protein [Staphylococcus condimenti]RZI00364.1 hypothetical protein EIG99_11730 [Staphylococcus condimenti]
MTHKNEEKSLDEINQEIEEELRNYNPEEDEDNKKKRNTLFKIPGILLFLIILGLACYRIFHFFL